MATKLSKSALKSIIKECLVEILAEGLGNDVGDQLLEVSSPVQKKRKGPKSSRRRPALDSVRFNQRLDESVSNMTNDPVMASIFKDTAKTTLQEQISGETRGNTTGHLEQVMANGDAAAKAVSKADPNEIFGESASNWSTLAFS